MQHMNLCGPGASPVTFTVLPGATTTTPGAGTPWTSAHAGARSNGTVPAGAGGLTAPFKRGTNPPPKFATSVNVCVSPPALIARTACPARIEIYPGEKFQAGCPTVVTVSGENSSATNSPKVVSNRCGVAAHTPGITALNVAGSQLSTNAILGSLLATWAVATFLPMADAPTNTASP